MFLKNLSLLNFKNITQAEITFGPSVNCFTGDNGEGKTNLLDAVHYLSLCKSYFNPIDTQNILHHAPFFVIQGSFVTKGEEEHVYCGLKSGQKKLFKRNQKEYQRLADHVGLFPVVMITPTDSSLIMEGSEERRKLVDSIISQFDKNYLENLIRYNKVLSQRNALLKQFAQQGHFSADSLDIWDEQMIGLGTEIYKDRADFMQRYLPLFSKFFAQISAGKEEVHVEYDSQLSKGEMRQLLQEALRKDRAFQHSTVGIHKDDLLFTIGGHPLKKFASQGQQKSFLLALKLAQFEFMSQVKDSRPLLLLDDIFDKLDESRVRQLMELVSRAGFGQVFITDTHPDRLPRILERFTNELSVFNVRKGEVTGV